MTFAFTDEDYREHVDRVEKVLTRLRTEGTDSRSLYGTVRRGWTLWNAERRAMHRALVRDLWEAVTPSTRGGGVAYVLGGLPGSGKTTIRSDTTNPIFSIRFLVLDPEDIEREMAQRGMIPRIDGLSPMEASPLVHEEAWEILNRLAQLAYRGKVSVLWEVPMASQRSRQHVDLLNAEGYVVLGGFADAPVEQARERVLRQHRQGEDAYRNGHGSGGRYVPGCVHEACLSGAPPDVLTRHRVPPGASVRTLLGRYEFGVLPFEHLVSTMRGRWHARSCVGVESADWVEVYRRCEAVPDEDQLFWINVAEDAGTISHEQAEALFSAIQAIADTD